MTTLGVLITDFISVSIRLSGRLMYQYILEI